MKKLDLSGAELDWEKVHRLLHESWTDPATRASSSSVAQSEKDAKDPTTPTSTAGRTLSLEVLDEATRGERADSVYEVQLEHRRLVSLGARDGMNSPLVSLHALRSLSLGNNYLSESDTANSINPLAELRELNLEANRFEAVPSVTNPKLESFRIAHNTVTALENIALPKLQSLDVSFNRISVISEKTVRLPALTALNLSQNRLSSITTLAPLIHLTELNVAGNELTSLSGVDGMSQLQDLNASKNKLRYTALLQHANPLRSLSKLETLDVASNNITSLAFFPASAMGNVWSLNLSSNGFLAASDAAEQSAKAKKAPKKKEAFEQDEVPEAEYGDEDPPLSKRSGKSTSGTAAASARPTGSSRLAMTKTEEPKKKKEGPQQKDETSFLARLSVLCPQLQVLDLSNNSPDVLPDYGDLRFLAKCNQLTELKLKGTCDCSTMGVDKKRHIETILSYLPQLETLDKKQVQSVKPATVQVQDVEEEAPVAAAAAAASMEGSRPHSAKTGAPPQQRGRPTAPLNPEPRTRPRGTEAEIMAFRQQISDFFEEAARSRRKCDRLVSHMGQSWAWGYAPDDDDRTPPPDATDINFDDDPNDKKRQVSMRDDSSDDENIAEQRPTPTPKKPPPKESSTAAKGGASGASPQSKKFAAALVPPDLQTGVGAEKQITPTKAHSAHALRGSSRGDSSTPSKMQRAQSSKAGQPLPGNVNTSFASEQQAFKRQVQQEAEQRRRELLGLVQSAKVPPPPSKDPLFGSKKKLVKTCESGTSTISPDKEETLKKVNAPTNRGRKDSSTVTEELFPRTGKQPAASETPPSPVKLIDNNRELSLQQGSGEDEEENASNEQAMNSEALLSSLRPSSALANERGGVGASTSTTMETPYPTTTSAHSSFVSSTVPSGLRNSLYMGPSHNVRAVQRAAAGGELRPSSGRKQRQPGEAPKTLESENVNVKQQESNAEGTATTTSSKEQLGAMLEAMENGGKEKTVAPQPAVTLGVSLNRRRAK